MKKDSERRTRPNSSSAFTDVGDCKLRSSSQQTRPQLIQRKLNPHLHGRRCELALRQTVQPHSARHRAIEALLTRVKKICGADCVVRVKKAECVSCFLLISDNGHLTLQIKATEIVGPARSG